MTRLFDIESRLRGSRRPPEPGARRQSSGGSGDSLALCLDFLLRYFGNARDVASISADLPHDGDRLSLAGFIQAADRAELAAQVIGRPIRSIPALALPAVLLLADGTACLLIKVEAEGRATIVGPVFVEGVKVISLAKLEAEYAGRAILVRPRFSFQRSSEIAGDAPATDWLRRILLDDWPIYAQAIGATVVINLLALVLPFFMSIVFDRVIPHRALDTLHVLAVGVAFAALFDFGLRSVRAHFIDTIGRRADVLLSSRVLSHVLALKLGNRERTAGGLANAMKEFEAVREFFTSATLATLADLPFALVFILVIALFSGPLAVVPAMALFLLIAIALAGIAPLNAMTRDNYRLGGQRHAFLIEILANIETLKSVRAEAWAQRLYERQSAESAVIGYRVRRASQLMSNLSALIYFLAPVATLAVGVHQLSSEAISTGALFAVLMLSTRALAPMGQFTALLTRLYHAVNAIRAVDRIMRQPSEHDPGRTKLYPSGFRGGMEFRNVGFTYDRRDQPALADVSFVIRPGERVAVVGRVGSGKSTLARLLLNLHEPQKGAVLVDGADVRQIDPQALRRAVAYVPQDIALFAGSIRENIAIGAPWSEPALVLKAARVAGLDSFVAESAEGLDRQIGERGEGLSGGQRQAISVARGLLLDPQVLVLDEPSSMMDTAGEKLLRDNLAQWLENRTLLLITHRASMLALVERIIVLDHGRIVADGPRDQVLRHLRAAPAMGV